jgi:phosphoglycolate phosphatase
MESTPGRAPNIESFKMLKTDAYLFDIDGTLLVTRDLVHWNGLHQAMLEVYGVDTNIEGLSYHGKTDVAILRAALNRCGVSDPVFAAGLEQARAVLCREVSAHAAGFQVDVCPGIREFLAQLQDDHKLLGVASGNLESVGWHKLSAAGLREFFSVGSFGDRFEFRVEIFAHAVGLVRDLLGNRAAVCFVGDTPDDIVAARAVNAQIISVCTGTFTVDELASHLPDVCCHTCSEILDSQDSAAPATKELSQPIA